MILMVRLVLFSIFFSVSFSSSNSTISLIDRIFFRSSSPIVSIALRTIGEREIVFSTSICPRSMRLAMATSPSRVSSGTVPISHRYMRTVSFDFSSVPGVRSNLPSSAVTSSLGSVSVISAASAAVRAALALETSS